MSDSTSPAIEVRGLRKSYGTIEAVRGIDLQVSKGEVFALLGPNGAGKTTTVEILEGHRDRTSGDVQVLGYDPARNERGLKERIGIVLQSTGVEPFLSVEESIDLFRGYYPHPLPLEEILDATGLREQRRFRGEASVGGPAATAGRGHRPWRETRSSCSWTSRPPGSTHRPAGAHGTWSKNLQALGKTVVLTTHYMDEAEFLADRVAIMAHGEIVAEGSPADLAKETGATTIRFTVGSAVDFPPEDLRTGPPDGDGRYTVTTDSPTRSLHQLTGWAVERGIELEELSVSRPSLEDVFLKLSADGEAEPE